MSMVTKASSFKKSILICSVILLTACLTNCSSTKKRGKGTYEGPSRVTREEDKICNFVNGDKPKDFYFANGYKNNNPFNCYWTDQTASIETSLSLSLYKAEGKYYGAEYRSFKTYSSGYYSVSMKPAKCPGVISSFFTYLGNPWDEIDIEFVGKDTKAVQFNYFHNGNGGHEYIYELDYDASESFHEYGFYWDKTQIIWYVDTIPVHRADTDIPQKDMNIMMNVWNGVGSKFSNWAGTFDETKLPVKGEYEWIAYQKITDQE